MAESLVAVCAGCVAIAVASLATAVLRQWSREYVLRRHQISVDRECSCSPGFYSAGQFALRGAARLGGAPVGYTPPGNCTRSSVDGGWAPDRINRRPGRDAITRVVPL